MHTVNPIFSALFAIIIYIRTCIHAGVRITTPPGFCESTGTCGDPEFFSRGCLGSFPGGVRNVFGNLITIT